ncbi:unnamed protein product [Lota lota]
MFSLKALRKNKTVRYGVPMLLLIVGGSFGLREFTQIRYDPPPLQMDPSLEARVDPERQAGVLQEEYQKLQEVKLDEWRNIRGPRPWEDSKEYQEQQRSRRSPDA